MCLDQNITHYAKHKTKEYYTKDKYVSRSEYYMIQHTYNTIAQWEGCTLPALTCYAHLQSKLKDIMKHSLAINMHSCPSSIF